MNATLPNPRRHRGFAMFLLRLSVVFALLVFTRVCLAAGDDTSAPDRPVGIKRGLSWLLPIAFQSEPDLSMTFITEMSEAGRKITPPTPEKPASYVIHASGAHAFGDNTYRTKPPTEEDLRRTMHRTLAAAHYLEVDAPERAPELCIFYH